MNVRNTWISLAFSAALVAASLPAGAQNIDLSKKPDPAPVKEVPFPKYEEKTLKNGMKVLIIEDHEQPTVMLRMQLTPGTTADGDKPGLATLTAGLLTKGADSRSALDIAKALDGIGASISANATGDATTITASGLKKHLGTILDIYADVVLRPTLSSEELEKLRMQAIEGVRYEKSEPGQLVQALARKAVYGENHPYAKKESEESLQAITQNDIKTFHSTYYKPGSAYLAVVGDITAKEIMPMLEKAFGSWSGGKAPVVAIPKADPMPKGVYFIERPASVQSSFVITGPTEPFSHPDFESISFTADVIGSGFGGRLFRTLRETYSYTYTPFGFVTRAKETNRFVAGADVRSAVTDSAIIVTKRELDRLTTEPPTQEELFRLKRYTVGSFLMSFENTESLASLLQLAALNIVPFTRVKNYPSRFMAITPGEVQKTAARYMDPDNLTIVVVGTKDVVPKLEQFGTIYPFNLEIEPVRMEKAVAADITAEELLARHIKATGGMSTINNLTSLQTTSQVTLQAGPQSMQGKGVTKHKAPGMVVSVIELPVMKQQRWVSGGKAWESTNGMAAEEQTGTALEEALYNARIVPLADLNTLGYKATVAGKQGNTYILKLTSPSNNEKTLYIDAGTMMVNKVEYSMETPQGTLPVTEEYADYREVAGVKLPHTMKFIMPGGVTITSNNTYEANPTIGDAEFVPPQGK